MATGTTKGLALDGTALIALVKPGMVTKAAGASAGSVDLSFSAASTAFDYLAKDEILTLTYMVAIDDGDGGVTVLCLSSSPSPAPMTRLSIVGEVDPPAQTVIVAAPTALDRACPGRERTTRSVCTRRHSMR